VTRKKGRAPGHRWVLATSSATKFAYLSDLTDARLRLRWHRRSVSVMEGDDARVNAERKAISASKRVASPVVATDEALRLPKSPSNATQPGARVRRMAGEFATDEAVIAAYARLLSSLPEEHRWGRLAVHLALARRGRLLGSWVISRRIRFAVPPAATWLPGRPLSAFHVVPPSNKRYAELNEAQRRRYDSTLRRRFAHVIRAAKARLAVQTGRSAVGVAKV
jgi:hypothetical protein